MGGGEKRPHTAHRTPTTHPRPYDDEAVHAAAGPGVQSGQKLTKGGKQGQHWLRLDIKAREGLGVEDDPKQRGAYHNKRSRGALVSYINIATWGVWQVRRCLH